MTLQRSIFAEITVCGSKSQALTGYSLMTGKDPDIAGMGKALYR